MADILYNHQTYLIAYGETLYPSENLFPSEDLFPSEEFTIYDKFESGSISVSEIIADGDIEFGVPMANKFECRLYDEVDIGQEDIDVYQVIDGISTPVFSGKVDSAKLDKSGTYRTIIAYDYLYWYSTINVADWWESFWENKETATLKELRTSLVTYVGMTEPNVALVNDNMVCKKSVSITNIAFKDMFKMILELSGVFPNINRIGVLEYITLGNTTQDISDEYETNNSEFQAYTTGNITGIHFTDSNGDSKRLIGEDFNAYTIPSNILTFELSTEELDTVGTNLLNAISGISYTPADINMIVSNLDYKLGDKVETEQGETYILEQTYSGVQLVEQNIIAQGNELLPQVEKSADLSMTLLGERIGRVSQTLESFEVEYEDFAEETSTALTQTANAFVLAVNNQGKVALFELLADRTTGSTNFIVDADNISLEGKTFNLSADLINIKSNHFSVDTLGNTEIRADRLIKIMDGNTDVTSLYDTSKFLGTSDSVNDFPNPTYVSEGSLMVVIQSTGWLEEHPIGTPITIKYKNDELPKSSGSNAEMQALYPNIAENDLYLNTSTGKVYLAGRIVSVSGGTSIEWNYQYDLSPSYNDDRGQLYQCESTGNVKSWELKPGHIAHVKSSVFTVEGGLMQWMGGTININNKFLVDEDGNLNVNDKLTIDNQGNFNVNDKFIIDKNGNLNVNDVLEILNTGKLTVNDYFIVNADGSLNIGEGAFQVNANGITQVESLTADDKISVYTHDDDLHAGSYSILRNELEEMPGGRIDRRLILEVTNGFDVLNSLTLRTINDSGYATTAAYIDEDQISVISPSDRRLKENFTNITENYEKAYYEIQPLMFNFIGKDVNEIGIVAQDFEKTLEKYHISENNCFIKKQRHKELGERYSIDYVKLTSWNMHMIQKQHKEIEVLKDELATLKEQVNKLLKGE